MHDDGFLIQVAAHWPHDQTHIVYELLARVFSERGVSSSRKVIKSGVPFIFIAKSDLTGVGLSHSLSTDSSEWQLEWSAVLCTLRPPDGMASTAKARAAVPAREHSALSDKAVDI